MIREVKKDTSVTDILKSSFNGYQISEDPFEKIATYTKNGIIGIISYSIMYERGEINYIVVSEEQYRQGIGSDLLEYALADMIKTGVKDVSLEVECSNKSAINLYLKYGFKKEAIRPNYYSGNDGYLMTKKLEVIK